MKINALEFDQIAREVFAPIYPVIAQQIKKQSGMNEGVCVDIGCGGGYLGLAMAEITKMQVYLMDYATDMLSIAGNNIFQRGLTERVQTILGDVHAIPLADKSVDLAISRGSLFFWDDQPKAFQEINRILAPGGLAWIGGGFGTPELKKQIAALMVKRNPNWPDKMKKNIGPVAVDKFKAMLQAAGLTNYNIQHDDAGLWIVLRGEDS